MRTPTSVSRDRTPIRALSPLALALLAAAALAGCFNPFSPRVLGRGTSSTAPAPSSPENLLRRFEWSYNNRAIAEYRELFTDDYRFVFAAADSSGQAYRDNPWTREDELSSATGLFQRASQINLRLDKNFYADRDPRPGKAWPWHKRIRTSVALTILMSEGGQTDVIGFARFFLTRGDSAAIPEELKLKGFGADSSRWYIERWEDETLQSGTQAALRPAPPGGKVSRPATPAAVVSDFWSWGRVKIVYR